MLARTRLFKRGRYNGKTRFKLYLSCYNYCDDSSRRCIQKKEGINWYSSVEVLDELGKRFTDFIGTVRKDCKALPKDIVNANGRINVMFA